VDTAQISQKFEQSSKGAAASFFWLSAFYVVYCIRPEDWLHFLGRIPLAKVTAIGALLAVFFGTARGKRKLRDLPRESHYLLAMIGVFVLSSVLSPVWRGGALNNTLNFAKVYVAWVLTFLLVTNLKRFRRIVFIQAGAVPAICILSILKSRSHPRLDGALGGIYSNPNDLAFAIVLSLPFCLMFLLTARGAFRKLAWVFAMLAMAAALVLTASRGGFITLIVAGAVCLWHFGVKGKRIYLIAASALVVLILIGVAGGPLKSRFAATFSDDGDTTQEASAHGSYENRKYLMSRALEGIERYPILGIGTMNFEVYSLDWHEVHMTYLEIAVEGGLVSLILYLLFFWRGFRNLHLVMKRKDLGQELKLFAWALHSSLVGFIVGALFSPEAYQFFPYFAVAYTSVLFALAQEGDRLRSPAPSLVVPRATSVTAVKPPGSREPQPQHVLFRRPILDK
jgi:O-antigen ligase